MAEQTPPKSTEVPTPAGGKEGTTKVPLPVPNAPDDVLVKPDGSTEHEDVKDLHQGNQPG